MEIKSLSELFSVNDLIQIYNSMSSEFKDEISNVINSPTVFFTNYYTRSSDKCISSLVEYLSNSDDKFSLLGQTIEYRFRKQWKRLINVFSEQYDLLSPYSMQTNENNEINSTSDSTGNVTDNVSDNVSGDSNVNSNETENSRYGFNSASAVPTEKSQNSSNTTYSNDSTRNQNRESKNEYNRTDKENRNIERRGNIGNLTSQDLLEKEIEFSRQQIWVYMFKDIDLVLTLGIYKNKKSI